jgi:hypothetical protein
VIAYLLMDRMPNIVTLKASFVKKKWPLILARVMGHLILFME